MICGCDSDCHRAVIFTGALPVLQALKSGDLSDVRVVLGHLSEDKLYCSGYHLIVVYLGMERQTDLLMMDESAGKQTM